MKTIEPFTQDEDQLRRAASRHGLCFHINQFGYLTEHAGWKSEERPATDPELAMWWALVGMSPWRPGDDLVGVPVPDATAEELEYALWGGPYTLSAADLATLRLLEGFVPYLDRERLLRGLVGRYKDADIYVSRAIPKGYYYEGTIPLWRPPEGGRQLDPGLPPELEAMVRVEMRAFGVV